MHDIEPNFKWRDLYIASEDRRSPFYGYSNSDVAFTHQLYNFYIHPQWDAFGSTTLYLKVTFVDYVEGYALIELMGEWNDTLHNDIMFLKREVIEKMMNQGITKFVFFCEFVLNFHAQDTDYYEEWSEEMRDEGGWAAFINTRSHVEEEMEDYRLHYYLLFGEEYNDINWRPFKPDLVYKMIEKVVNGEVKRLSN
jgi:hypothetical protein